MSSVSEEFEADTSVAITDAEVERARLLVGLVAANHRRDYISEATRDSIRNFAIGYGDDNPLFIDEEYGLTTRWRTQIAPPMMLAAAQDRMFGDPLPQEVRERTRGLFRGVHSFVSGGSWEWFRPICSGDRIYSFGGIESVEAKESEFAGRSVIQTKAHIKINQAAKVLGIARTTIIYASRREARERAKYAGLELGQYSEEQIAEIDAIYAQERRRGGEPRYFEDVEVGEELPKMVKGPLTVTDVVIFHAGGFGFQPFMPATGRLGYRNRQRIPAFYIRNGRGVPDVAQRVHWDSDWAKAIGNPEAYDYGAMRECWVQHSLTDWMGDDGWICQMKGEIRKFNYIGDTQFLGGRVVAKRLECGRHLVDLDVSCINQRGEETIRERATVQLPSRDGGLGPLPEPDPALERTAQRMLDRHRELLATVGRAELLRDPVLP